MKLFYKQLGVCLLFLCTMFTGEVAQGQTFAANLTIEGVLCPGDSFQVIVNAEHGVAPYEVSRLLTPPGHPDYNAFSPDTADKRPAPFETYQQPDTTHYYHVTDAVGNSFIVAAQPNTSNLLQMQALPSSILCSGDSADVNVQAIGGVQPHTGTGMFRVPAGTHTFTVTDNEGCTVSETVTINSPTPLVLTSTTTDETCNGSDGTATASVSGGIPPYTYMWAPGGQMTDAVTGLAAGMYTVTVTDSNGCVTSSKVSIGNTCNNACNDSLRVDSCFCGETLPAINSQFSVQGGSVISGADYRFRIVNVGLGIDTVISSIASQPGGDFSQLNNRRKTSLAFLDPCDMQYSTTYTVYVSAFVNGAWTDFNDSCPCDITTPAAPAPRLSTQYCNDTVPYMNSPLVVKASSRVFGARAYQYCFIDTANDDTIMVVKDGHRPWVTSFYQASGVNTGTTYCIYVKAEICVGGAWVWTASGDPCYVTTPGTRRYQSGENGTIGEQSNSLTPGFQSDVKNHETTMTLYPNPSKGSETLLSLENLGKNSTVNVMVVDFQGKQVYNKKFNPSNDSLTTSIQFNQRLTPGTYFIYVNAGEKRMSQKLIIR